MFAEEEVAERSSKEPLPIDVDVPSEGGLNFRICEREENAGSSSRGCAPPLFLQFGPRPSITLLFSGERSTLLLLVQGLLCHLWMTSGDHLRRVTHRCGRSIQVYTHVCTEKKRARGIVPLPLTGGPRVACTYPFERIDRGRKRDQ